MDHNPILQSIANQVAPGASSGSSDPKLQFSVPCFEVEYQESQAPTLRYIFYDLPFPELPFKMSFHLVNGWIGSKRERRQEIKILKPDGSVFVKTGMQPLQFVDENTPFMAVNFFPDMPFDAPGLYQIVVFLEEREVLRYPLTVRIAEQQNANRNLATDPIVT
jgi:Family of unknown function (DUF6941)